MTTIDLLTRPQLRSAARDYFVNVQTKDQKYVPMITASDVPALEINSAIMTRYAPQQAKFYYDAAKYPTYLEQLGIKFPITENPAAMAPPK